MVRVFALFSRMSGGCRADDAAVVVVVVFFFFHAHDGIRVFFLSLGPGDVFTSHFLCPACVCVCVYVCVCVCVCVCVLVCVCV